MLFNSLKQFSRIYPKQNLIQKSVFKFSNQAYTESFIQVSKENPFPIQNIPFGVFTRQNQPERRIAVALGDNIIDIKTLAEQGVFSQFSQEIQNALKSETLNEFLGLSKSERKQVREFIQSVLAKGSSHQSTVENKNVILSQSEVTMVLPMQVGDYTDFYASRKHAENVGEMFRGADNKLMPNWLHMPIAYHGRSSSVGVDKTIVRPSGQIDLGKFGDEQKLDIELEMAMIIGGKKNQQGTPIPIQDAKENIAGYMLMNDLSARQIQRIEYQPLGPFLGKNFGTTLSPWVVLPEALEPFRKKIDNQPDILPYLQSNDLNLYNIPLQIYLQPGGQNKRFLVSESNMENLYWTFEQMVAHHTSNGCPFRPGDVLGSGTITGEDASKNAGSFLELTWNGTKPMNLDGVQRTFLEDGDTVVLAGGRQLECGQMIGFGEVETTIVGKK